MLEVAIQWNDYHILALLVQVGDLVLSHVLPSVVDETFQHITTFSSYLIGMDMYAA